MIRRLAPVVLTGLSISACGGPSGGLIQSGPPTGTDGRAIRTPCEAGALVMLDSARMTCNYFLPEPESDDRRFWSGDDKPCRRTIELPGGAEGQKLDYDYSKGVVFPGAEYNDDGNIIRWNALQATGFELIVAYDYDGELLTGARVEAPVSSRTEYRYFHEDDRRVQENEVDGPSDYHYVYEDGRLIAAGPPVDGAPPVRYEESFLQPGADGKYPNVPELDLGRPDAFFSASAPHWTYFYEGDRLKSSGRGGPPGLGFIKMSYEYAGDELVAAHLDGNGDTNDSNIQPQTLKYDYVCE